MVADFGWPVVVGVIRWHWQHFAYSFIAKVNCHFYPNYCM